MHVCVVAVSECVNELYYGGNGANVVSVCAGRNQLHGVVMCCSGGGRE